MNGHLARLAVRATQPSAGGLRPRVGALFEQPAGPPDAGPGAVLRPVEGDGNGPPWGVPPSSGPATADARPVVPTTSSAAGDRPVGTLLDAGQEHDDDGGVRHALRSPALQAPSPARTAAAASAVRAGLDEPAGGAPPSSPGTSSLPSPAPSAGSTLPEHVAASVVADAVVDVVAGAVAARLHPSAADARPRQRPAEEDRTTRPGSVPTVRPPALAPRPVAPLPRLQGTGQTARGDGPRAAPQVTVSIGRIEVVPPQPGAPQQQRPTPRTRASGAPPLADYLRDRSRR